MDMIFFMCWKCGKENIITNSIGRSTECEYCGADLRCCKNCKFYDVGSHYDCHEQIDQLVQDKEGANFCDYFSFVTIQVSSTDSVTVKAKDARNTFNSLFGD